MPAPAIGALDDQIIGGRRRIRIADVLFIGAGSMSLLAAGMCLALRHSLALARALLGSPTGSLPPCGCEGDLRRRWLAHLASESVLLRKRPRHHPSRVLLGLVPLVSLDHARAAAQLVQRRLQLFPEYARYRLGQALSPDQP